VGDDAVVISVSHELAPKLHGAALDFGSYNKMERFVWLTMPAVKGPACTCVRSIGAPAGKRSPCLDDQGPWAAGSLTPSAQPLAQGAFQRAFQLPEPGGQRAVETV
jgi:hypothetical protein